MKAVTLGNDLIQADATNIILAGGSSLISGLGESLKQALSRVGKGRIRTVEDPIFAGSDGGLALAVDALDSDWESVST